MYSEAGLSFQPGIEALRKARNDVRHYKRGVLAGIAVNPRFFLDPRGSCRGNEHLTTGDSQPLRTVRSAIVYVAAGEK